MAVAVINTLRIYEKLKEKFDEPQARAAVEAIERSFEEYRENQREFLATKEDLTRVEAGLREDLTRETSQLELKIEQVRTELIRWMFIFWVGQFAAIVGTLTAILFAFFK